MNNSDNSMNARQLGIRHNLNTSVSSGSEGAHEGLISLVAVQIWVDPIQIGLRHSQHGAYSCSGARWAPGHQQQLCWPEYDWCCFYTSWHQVINNPYVDPMAMRRWNAQVRGLRFVRPTVKRSRQEKSNPFSPSMTNTCAFRDHYQQSHMPTVWVKLKWHSDWPQRLQGHYRRLLVRQKIILSHEVITLDHSHPRSSSISKRWEGIVPRG